MHSIIHPQTSNNLIKLQYIADITAFLKWMIKKTLLKPRLNHFHHHCPKF